MLKGCHISNKVITISAFLIDFLYAQACQPQIQMVSLVVCQENIISTRIESLSSFYQLKCNNTCDVALYSITLRGKAVSETDLPSLVHNVQIFITEFHCIIALQMNFITLRVPSCIKTTCTKQCLSSQRCEFRNKSSQSLSD